MKSFAGKIWEIIVGLVADGIILFLLTKLSFDATLSALGKYPVEATLILLCVVIAIASVASTISRAIIRWRVKAQGDKLEKLKGSISELESEKNEKKQDLANIENIIRDKTADITVLKDKASLLNSMIAQKNEQAESLSREIDRLSKRRDEIENQISMQLINVVFTQTTTEIINVYDDARKNADPQTE